MRRVDFYPAVQFAIVRILLGIYLFVHSLCLLPYAADIFSREGMLPDPSVNWNYGIFPNPLNIIDSPLVIQCVFALLAGLALLFTAGVYRRPVALLLWFLWACLLNRNNYMLNPSVPAVGWLLLVASLVPYGEGWSMTHKNAAKHEWWLPAPLYWGCWAVVGASYSISGILKIPAPSWQDGRALIYSVDQLYGRDWFLVDWFISLPLPIIQYMTWGVLMMEVLFLPLCLSFPGRFIAWLAMTGMHVALLFLMIFIDLTIPLLILHLFLFDMRWIRVAKDRFARPLIGNYNN